MVHWGLNGNTGQACLSNFKKEDSPMKGRSLRTLFLFAFFLTIMLVAGPVSSYAAEPQKAPVDLNTASQKEIEAIKGVGPATAKKIIESRPYASVDELSKAGLSPKMIEKIKPFVTVGKTPAAAPAVKPKAPPQTGTTAPAPAKTVAPTPGKTAATQKTEAATEPAAKKTPAAAKLAPGQVVNINTANKEQIEMLPGIGPVKAQAIIDGRPYNTKEDIMKVKGIKQGTFDKIKDSITVK